MNNQLNTQFPDDHPDIKFAKIGVVLVNLGTPENCDAASVRTYLAEFLSDTRVIELNPMLWKIILNGFILPFRPRRVAKNYQKIWLDDPSESPLKRYTRKPAQTLQQWFQSNEFSDKEIMVDWAMRYGEPSLESVINSFQQKGCEKILICPLYPQYSAATTATVVDKVNDILKRKRWQPNIRFLSPYYGNPDYIAMLAASIKDKLSTLQHKPELLLASFHGLPEDSLTKGDPYYCHCSKTTRLLKEQLKGELNVEMAFQSRFGPKQWLKPYATETLVEKAKQGIKHIAVITPGFSADCLETLEEMAMENKKLFIDNGGESYHMIPCLNDSDYAMQLYKNLIRNELSGWI
jgi:ferrochelatase